MTYTWIISNNINRSDRHNIISISTVFSCERGELFFLVCIGDGTADVQWMLTECSYDAGPSCTLKVLNLCPRICIPCYCSFLRWSEWGKKHLRKERRHDMCCYNFSQSIPWRIDGPSSSNHSASIFEFPFSRSYQPDRKSLSEERILFTFSPLGLQQQQGGKNKEKYEEKGKDCLSLMWVWHHCTLSKRSYHRPHVTAWLGRHAETQIRSSNDNYPQKIIINYPFIIIIIKNHIRQAVKPALFNFSLCSYSPWPL